MRTWLLSWKEKNKRLAVMCIDLLLIWLALWLAICAHLGGITPIAGMTDGSWLFLVAPLVSIPVFIRLGMYRVVLRYTDIEALIIITRAVSLSGLLFALFIGMQKRQELCCARW